MSELTRGSCLISNDQKPLVIHFPPTSFSYCTSAMFASLPVAFDFLVLAASISFRCMYAVILPTGEILTWKIAGYAAMNMVSCWRIDSA
jgi:hypothetical protein